MNQRAFTETEAPLPLAKSACAGSSDKTEEACFDTTADADLAVGAIWHDAVGKWLTRLATGKEELPPFGT